MRQRLPNRRGSIRFSIEYDGLRYGVTAGFFPGGKLGEIFLDAAKPNSTLGVLVSDAAILASLLLQSGVPAESIVHSIAGPLAKALDQVADRSVGGAAMKTLRAPCRAVKAPGRRSRRPPRSPAG